MTPEQQLEKLLNDLAKLERHEFYDQYGDCMMIAQQSDGDYVLWQDIEAILKQTFPDDEFH